MKTIMILSKCICVQMLKNNITIIQSLTSINNLLEVNSIIYEYIKLKILLLINIQTIYYLHHEKEL